jgi:hypothetical protein
MKTMKRKKITKADLEMSKTLEFAEYLIYPYKGTELHLYSLTSEICETEQEAIKSLETKRDKILVHSVENEYFSMDDEIKVWCSTDLNKTKCWVAYETFAVPGVTLELAQQLLKKE